jgi:hypothetical protein
VSPRVREDSVHPRLWSGASVRPLNFTVRRRGEVTVQVSPIALSTLTVVAYAVLTLAGVLLWRRARSFATAMVAIGFAIVLLDQVILLVSYSRMIASVRSHSGDTLYVIYHRANSLHVVLVGLSVAAVGLLWHALGSRR